MSIGSNSVLPDGAHVQLFDTNSSERGKGAVIIVLAIAAALVLGAGTALAGIWMGLLGAGVFSVAFAFALPLHWLILLDLVLATVVAGSAEYFLGLSQAHWIPYVLGLILALRALVERGAQVGTTLEHGSQPTRLAFKIPAVAYVAILLGSTAINLAPGLQVITGIKNFLFMWGVLFAMIVVREWQRVAVWFWRVVLVVACLQLPVTLYQRVFVASKANNHVPWDSVVGTFGGIPLLGGHSASMTLFICAGLAWVLIGWRDGQLARSRVLLYLALAMPTVLLAEVKAVVIWLLVGTLLVFARFARTRPLTFVAGVLLNAVLVSGVVLAYVTFNYGGGSTSFDEMYEKQISYIYDAKRFNPKSRELGRVSSIVFWAQEQSLSEPVSLLVGNGMGASRGLATLGTGEVAKRYNFFIDTSALSVLLWDAGVLGAGAFVTMLLFGGWQALRLARDPRLPPTTRRLAEASGVALLLILSGVPYTRDAVDDTSIQFLLYFCLACVARIAAQSSARARGGDVATG